MDQYRSRTIPALQKIYEFVGVGGYWFTDRTANDALGSPKFTGTTSLFVKPAHRHNMLITGGIELVGASENEVTIAAGEGIVAIPYDQIARSNLIPGD